MKGIESIARGMITRTEKWAKDNGYHQIRAWSSEDKIEVIPMWYALEIYQVNINLMN